MFESRVLGNEQGSYRVWCSMTPATGGLGGHSLSRTLDLDTECFPASQVQEALGALSLCTSDLGPAPAGAAFRSALGERALPVRAAQRMFPVGLQHCSRVLLQK